MAGRQSVGLCFRCGKNVRSGTPWELFPLQKGDYIENRLICEIDKQWAKEQVAFEKEWRERQTQNEAELKQRACPPEHPAPLPVLRTRQVG